MQKYLIYNNVRHINEFGGEWRFPKHGGGKRNDSDAGPRRGERADQGRGDIDGLDGQRDADGAPAPAPRRVESSPLYDGAAPRAGADDGRAVRRSRRDDEPHGDGDETGEGRRASRRAAADALYTGVSTERDSSKG